VAKLHTPLHIEAHEGSSVIVGCSGSTSINAAQTDTLETELLRVFRSLTVRERVAVMGNLYCYEDERTNDPQRK